MELRPEEPPLIAIIARPPRPPDKRLNPTAIFSKTGKGVQEASGKTSNLSRADRAVLKEIDGKTVLANIAVKFEKIPADKFDALIQQFDKDGYIREVSSGVTAPQAPPARSAQAPRAAPPPAAGDSGDEMDFTQAIKLPPKAPAPAAPKPPPMDLAAASRADAERKAKEQQGFDYKARAEAEAKAKAEAEAKARAAAQARAKAEAEAKARAAAEEKVKAETQARERADAEAKTRAEADAKVKAAREAAIRMATEVKARAEAEGKAKTDAAEGREREALEKARRESEDKARLEAELTAKIEEERRAREDAERRASEAADQTRKEMEEKAKRDADELRRRLEEEMKAKLEDERKAREAEDRKRREEDDRKRAEEDRKRREEDDRRRKEEEARRAKEEAERKAREEEDRKRREEEDRKRREEDDRRRKEDEERRANEAAERLARKEQEERRAREEVDRRKQDEERRAKEEADRRAKEEAERRAREEQDSKRRKEEDERRRRDEAERKATEEAEARTRAAQSASVSIPSIQPTVTPPPPPPAAVGGIDDSLLADLDSFGKREEEEQKAKEEADRKAREDAARKAKEEAERRAKDEAERRAKEEAEKKRREEAERKAQEDAEQLAREEEARQKQEEDERKRKAKEALAAKEATRKAAQRAAETKTAKTAAKDDDDIGVSDDDLDMDEVKKDQKALSATARKQAREQTPVAVAAGRRPRKWGKPAAIVLFVLMAGGVGVLQLMPVSTVEYEKAASEALGVPVKIASARLSVITGIEARFEGVSIGDTVKVRTVRGYPEVGSLFGVKKSFSRIELEGVSLSQSQLADAVLGKVSGENFRVGRVVIKQAKLDGPLTLPALDVEATVSGDGSLQSVSLRGPDKLSVQLSPKGNDIGFEIGAGSLALPFVPALNLSDFSMKGTANRSGVTNSEFDGRAFDGVISGSAKIRWGASWLVEGEVRARGVRVAVIAPALISEGKVDGRGAYMMSGPNPATLFESARIQGEFKIDKGVLGSFDLTRALQTGGAQTSGRTIFTELTGQVVYDKGTVKVTNAAIAAGAMNAGASLDVDANGGLSGRIVADVKTPNQTLRATLNISGKIQDPVIRK